MVKKLLSLLFSIPIISTGIYFGTKKSNNLTSSTEETDDLISRRKTESLIKKANEDFPKYCKILLNSRDLEYEILLCFDLDKENHLNKAFKALGHYYPSFFLLDKTHYTFKKINGLFSTLEKNVSWHGSRFSQRELQETTWQAFRRKIDIFNTPEILEKVGLPFTIKYRLGYPKSKEEGFLFPENNTEFMWRKNYDAEGRAVFRREALMVGSAFAKKHSWGDGNNVDILEKMSPPLSDPLDSRWIDFKRNAEYQVVLEKSDKFWNAGSANDYDALPKTKYFPHKDFVCEASKDLFEGKTILSCSESNLMSAGEPNS